MKNIFMYVLPIFFLAHLVMGDTNEEQILGPSLSEVVGRVLEEMNALRTSDSSLACTGRLTLTTAVPITVSDVTGASTIYFTPFNGSQIALYASSIWTMITFAETTVTVPSTTTTPFDVFGYSNSGTLALETLNWTNDTTRATLLTTQDGVYVKSGDATRRYLGTGRTTSTSGKIEDSVKTRFLWNAYNRAPRKLLAATTTASWNYTTATWRAANADTTVGTFRVEYVVGQQIDNVKIKLSNGFIYNASANNISMGLGINSTSTNSADMYGAVAGPNYSSIRGFYINTPSVGYTYAQWLEWSNTNGTTTWYGYDATNPKCSGFIGEIWN